MNIWQVLVSVNFSSASFRSCRGALPYFLSTAEGINPLGLRDQASHIHISITYSLLTPISPWVLGLGFGLIESMWLIYEYGWLARLGWDNFSPASKRITVAFSLLSTSSLSISVRCNEEYWLNLLVKYSIDQVWLAVLGDFTHLSDWRERARGIHCLSSSKSPLSLQSK